jgi:hypothetical protein
MRTSLAFRGNPARADKPFELGDERTVGGKHLKPLGRDVLQDRPRVLRAAPSLRVYPLPEDIGLVAPGPAQVERKLAERIRQVMGSDVIHLSSGSRGAVEILP